MLFVYTLTHTIEVYNAYTIEYSVTAVLFDLAVAFVMYCLKAIFVFLVRLTESNGTKNAPKQTSNHIKPQKNVINANVIVIYAGGI